MTWKIKAIAGPFVGQEIVIEHDSIIGRDPSVDIVLQGGHISRRHAALWLQEGQLWIKDLNSSNGTLVNGQRISQQELHPHDELQIDVIRFVVLNALQDTTQPQAAMAPVPPPLDMSPEVADPVTAPEQRPSSGAGHTQPPKTLEQPLAKPVEQPADQPIARPTAHPADQPPVQLPPHGQPPARPPLGDGPVQGNRLPVVMRVLMVILLIILAIWYFSTGSAG